VFEEPAASIFHYFTLTMDAAVPSEIFDSVFKITETLMMEVVDSSEIWAHFYQTTRVRKIVNTLIWKDGW
jgi:hypothetical protein